MECPKCKFQNRDGLNFCGDCGYNFKPVKETLDQFPTAESKPFSLPTDNPLKDTDPVPGERKHVTVLFSDLTGYTAMSEKLDPEEVIEITGRLFGKAAEIISKFEGFVEKYIGDAIVAIFGAKKSFEDDPIRAVEAAIEIHAFVNKICPEYEKIINVPISMHTGINTGLVVTGEINLEKGIHGIAGDTINVAARLSSHAKEDVILVSHSTYLRIYKRFDIKNIGEINVKGKSKPVTIYEVNNEISIKSKTVKYPGFDEFYLGRAGEIQMLQNIADSLSTSGYGSIVSIIGEAGIGKSRFIEEFKKKQKEGYKGINWIECKPPAINKSDPFYPFIQMLKYIFGIEKEDENQQALLKLQKGLSDFSDKQISESLPYLAKFLNLSLPDELDNRLEFLDGRAVKQQLYFFFRTLLSHLSKMNPIIIIFEDVHWIDSSSVDLIEHILPLTNELPLLMIFVSRTISEGHPIRLKNIFQKLYGNIYREILLKPLSAGESVKLVSKLLRLEEIPDQMRGLIMKKGEGNPFFIEELLQILISKGIIQRIINSNEWIIKEVEGELDIPDTIRGLLSSLIDRLDDEQKKILKIASVVGRTFLYKILAAIVETKSVIKEQLSELQAIKFIRQTSNLFELEYVFYHTLTKEVAYESILIRQRLEIHRQIGQTIENLFKDQKEKYYSELAYHYSQAKDWEKAQIYLFKAGDHAESIAADTEALGHYKKAISAYESAFSEKLESAQAAIFNRKIGEGFFRKGDHERALRYLRQAMSYYENPFPKTQWGTRFAIISSVLKQFLFRLIPGLLIGKGRKDSVDTIKERLRIYEIISWIDFFLNKERLTLNIIRTLNFVEHNGYVEGMVLGLTGIGFICDTINFHGIANIYHQKSLGLLNQIDSPVAKGHCYFGVGWHEDFLGNWEKAVEYYSRSADVFWEMGDLRRWGDPTIFIAFLHNRIGEFAKSLELSKEVSRIGENSGDKQLLGWGLHGQSINYFCLGNIENAQNQMQKAIELLKTVPDLYVMNLVKGDLALCHLYSGQFEAAFALLMESDQELSKMKFKGHFVCYLKNNIAEYYIRKMEGVGNNRDRSLIKKARKACKSAIKESKYYKWTIPRANNLQACFYWLSQNPEKAKRFWLKGLEAAENLGMKYEVALTKFEMGKCMNNFEYLYQALEIFSNIHALSWKEKTEELINLFAQIH